MKKLPLPPMSDDHLLDEALKFHRLSDVPWAVCDLCGAVARSLHELAISHKEDCPDGGVKYGC